MSKKHDLRSSYIGSQLRLIRMTVPAASEAMPLPSVILVSLQDLEANLRQSRRYQMGQISKNIAFTGGVLLRSWPVSENHHYSSKNKFSFQLRCILKCHEVERHRSTQYSLR